MNCHEYGNQCRCGDLPEDDGKPFCCVFPKCMASESRLHSMLWCSDLDLAGVLAEKISEKTGTPHTVFIHSVPDGESFEEVAPHVFVKHEDRPKSTRGGFILQVKAMLSNASVIEA